MVEPPLSAPMSSWLRRDEFLRAPLPMMRSKTIGELIEHGAPPRETHKARLSRADMKSPFVGIATSPRRGDASGDLIPAPNRRWYTPERAGRNLCAEPAHSAGRAIG
jgi:hypothetical protein